MTIEFHDPRGEQRRASEAYALALDCEAAVTIGLLANGFPDSVAFLDAVESALVRRYAKPGASAPASADLVARIAGECDALVTAYGH